MLPGAAGCREDREAGQRHCVRKRTPVQQQPLNYNSYFPLQIFVEVLFNSLSELNKHACAQTPDSSLIVFICSFCRSELRCEEFWQEWRGTYFEILYKQTFCFDESDLVCRLMNCQHYSAEQLLVAGSVSLPKHPDEDTEEAAGQPEKDKEDTLCPQLECVCYGLGPFSSCVSARFQLAMLLLLLEAAQVRERFHQHEAWHEALFITIYISLLFSLSLDPPEGLLCLWPCVLHWREGCFERAGPDCTHRKWGQLSALVPYEQIKL